MNIPADPARARPNGIPDSAAAYVGSPSLGGAKVDRTHALNHPTATRPGVVARIFLSPQVITLVAIGAAAGTAFLIGFRYRAQAVLTLRGDARPAALEANRVALLDFCTDAASTSAESPRLHPRCAASLRSPDRLVLDLTAIGRSNTAAAAQVTAGGFARHLRDLAQRSRITPGEVEAALSKSLEQTRADLAVAQSDLDSAMNAIPSGAESDKLRQMLARWKDLQPRLTDAREDLAAAAAGVAGLRSQPGTPKVVIDATRRRDALQADSALQQDLKELAVSLTELKLQLLNVWQQAGPVLERLTAQVDDLTVASTRTAPPAALVPQSAALETACAAYAGLLADFSRTWTARFTELKIAEVDPRSEVLLDTFLRTRQLVDEFLFRAGRELAALRAPVEALRTDVTDEARLHQSVSGLVRAFHALQATHHQFELLTGSLETAGNFRLDAALRASRGLTRRTQERIREIDERLHAEASVEAHRRRAEELARAEQTAESTRLAADQAIVELVSLQAELNQAVAESSQHQDKLLAAQAAAGRVAAHRVGLERLESALAEQAAQRLAAADAFGVTLESCLVDPTPVDLVSQAGIATLAGFSAFFMLLLVRGRALR